MEQGEQSIERSNTRLNRSRSKRLQGQKIFSTLFRPKGANYLTLHFHHAKIPFCLIVCKWNEWMIGKTADFILVFLQAVNKRTDCPFLRSSTLLFFFLWYWIHQNCLFQNCIIILLQAIHIVTT